MVWVLTLIWLNILYKKGKMNSFHIYRNPFADKNTVISKNGAEANQAFLFLLITLYNFHYSSLDSKLFYYWLCLPFKSKNWKCIPWNVMLGKIMSLWDGGEKNVQHKTILWKRRLLHEFYCESSHLKNSSTSTAAVKVNFNVYLPLGKHFHGQAY